MKRLILSSVFFASISSVSQAIPKVIPMAESQSKNMQKSETCPNLTGIYKQSDCSLGIEPITIKQEGCAGMNFGGIDLEVETVHVQTDSSSNSSSTVSIHLRQFAATAYDLTFTATKSYFGHKGMDNSHGKYTLIANEDGKRIILEMGKVTCEFKAIE